MIKCLLKKAKSFGEGVWENLFLLKRVSQCLASSRKGFTFIELLVVVAIISVLAAAAMPLSQITIRRTRELELSRTLRTMRKAIDQYKDNYDKHKYRDEEEIDRSGYPLKLEELVAKKLLRRIPVDPFTGENEWQTVSYTDKPDSMLTDGEDVYDVHSLSEEVALDGSRYNEW